MTQRRTILVNHLLEPPGRVTGITRFLFAILNELVRRPRFRYALVTTWQARELPAVLQHQNLTVITRPFHRSTPRNIAAQMTQMPRLMHQLGAALEFNCNPLGCFRPGWPRVVTVHDLYFDVMADDYRLRHRLWWRLFFPLVLASSAAVICVSESTRSDFVRFHSRFARKATVIHEAGGLIAGADPGHAASLTVPYALYVGNISPNKNPATLVAALKLLEQRGRPLKVYHVGRDEALLLARALDSAGLAIPVETVSGLSDAALAAAYRDAICLVVPSTREGFCLPVIEAQAQGTPVICSDIPVLREVAGESVLLFDPRDPAALADRLQRIVADKTLRERLAVAGRRNALRFSWSRAAAEAEALFERSIGDTDGQQRSSSSP
jgi:glycosyltransferase involved in cell wall biosynthesis